MKPNEQQRRMDLIEDRCVRLNKLLAHVAKLGTSVHSYLQDVGAIKRGAKRATSEEKLTEIEDKLTKVFANLKSTPAADGKAIISPERYNVFFNSSV